MHIVLISYINDLIIEQEKKNKTKHNIRQLKLFKYIFASGGL